MTQSSASTSGAVAVDPLDRIEAVHTSLKVLRRVTGLRVALVARTTQESWTVSAILDDAGLGFKAGDTLELSTTY